MSIAKKQNITPRSLGLKPSLFNQFTFSMLLDSTQDLNFILTFKPNKSNWFNYWKLRLIIFTSFADLYLFYQASLNVQPEILILKFIY